MTTHDLYFVCNTINNNVNINHMFNIHYYMIDERKNKTDYCSSTANFHPVK